MGWEPKLQIGAQQPKTGPRKLAFPIAGCAGLAVADRWLKPRAQTIKGKPGSTGISGWAGEAKKTGNTGILPENGRENTGPHGLPTRVIAN